MIYIVLLGIYVFNPQLTIWHLLALLYNVAIEFIILVIGMSRLPASSSLKRKLPDTTSPSDALTEPERLIYELITSKENMGIWSRDVKREVKLPDNVFNKCIKTLTTKRLIKEVVNIQNKGKKMYMGIEFEPSNEISGGAWYVDGNLDSEFVNFLKEQSLLHIRTYKIATIEMITDAIKRSRVLKDDYSAQQIGEIVKALVLDNMVMELTSTGGGEFNSIPPGAKCFKCMNKSKLGEEPKAGAMASIPCGVCPRIIMCTPDGIISPNTCVYYKKWLEF